MTGNPILSRFQAVGSQFQTIFHSQTSILPDLHEFWLHPERLPKSAVEMPVVQRTLDLLGPLDWQHFPERNLQRHWVQPAVSYAAFSGAMLVKLNEGLESMGDMRQSLVEHPGLIPLLGFRVSRCLAQPNGFDPDASLLLGFKPRFGTFDAAFDAWYVYDFFHRNDDPDAFAAVPFSEKGGYKAKGRQFSPEGLPLCLAGLPMPLHFTYTDTTVSLVEHQRGKYVCPLRFPVQSSQTCPVNHKNWAKKGCTAMMPTSIGARLRYTLDRDGQTYKDIYKQRTAVERINSQAKALGIERPHIRNGKAITNLNTLIYILINLRLLHRIRNRQPETD